MKKIKIITFVGTRPEIIRLSLVIKKLDQYFDHFFVHTGQNYDYELNEIFFEDLNLRKPDLNLNVKGKNSANVISNVISKSHELMSRELPDALLVLGDTNSCYSALSAKRLKIPIFHMEAGNRCFDFRVPEEINRKVIDHISDINLPYSNIAKLNLINEGLDINLIVKTGTPLREVFNYYNDKIEKSEILKKLNLKEKNYFLLSCHREENIETVNNFKNIINAINKIADIYRLPIIFSAHPRTQKILSNLDIKLHSLVNVLKPFNFTDYNKLQKNSKIVISDSGSINEESYILGFKAINLRESHERQEASEAALTITSGLKEERILQCVEIMDKISLPSQKINDYDVLDVSSKIVNLIPSYIDLVNSQIWRK